MEYGYFVNGQLIRVKAYREGAKPLTYTNKPEVDERHGAVFSWIERDSDIFQTWEIIEIEPEQREEEATESDYQAALNAMGVSTDEA